MQSDPQNLTVIPNEKILKQKERVWYYGGFSGFNKVALGHLILTSEKIFFFEQKPVIMGQIITDIATETLGLVFTIQLSNLTSAKVETRVRRKSSKPSWKDPETYKKIVLGKQPINQPASIINRKDQYSTLIMSFGSEKSDIDNLIFEVSDPMDWIEKLKLNSGGSADSSASTVSGRIATGIQDIDTLLLGGLPKGYSIILTSPSCDEQDLLIQRFLKNAATNERSVVYVCVDPSKILNIAKQYPTNIRILACNPRPDILPEDLPNLKSVKGLENLSDINIGLMQLLEKTIDEDEGEGEKIIILELVSEVLLQHKLLNTRRWLIDIIPRIKQKNFTILATFNPHMHSSESAQAMVDVFDGHVSLFEKEGSTSKYLQVKKMFNLDHSKKILSIDRNSIQN